MSSASKIFELLNFFAPARPELGLSELCKLAQRDKATTYRRLQSLVDAGLLEQNPITKRYRLGPVLLQLAQTREVTVPRKDGAEGPLHELADATGETTHVSVLSGNSVYPLVAVESPRHSIRVIIDIQTFPLHATSSGLCALAFGPAELLDTAKSNLTAFTENTVTSVAALNSSIKATRKVGFGQTQGSLEADVCSLAAPLFDQTGLLAGAVSVASIATRLTPELERIIKVSLVAASRKITHNWGGIVPIHVEQAWANALSQTQELEFS